MTFLGWATTILEVLLAVSIWGVVFFWYTVYGFNSSTKMKVTKAVCLPITIFLRGELLVWGASRGRIFTPKTFPKINLLG